MILLDNINRKTLLMVSFCFLVGTLLGVYVGYTYNPVSRGENTSVLAQKTTQSPVVTSTTTLETSPKTTPADPDVIIQSSYVAVVNGEKIEAPLKAISKDDTTATIKTTVDLTPLVSKMTPRWEAGVGLSYYDDGDTNKKVKPCASLQRNYKNDKAVEMIIHMDTHGNVKGGSVLHKWLF